jgi:SLOG in TRPM, prokaryote
MDFFKRFFIGKTAPPALETFRIPFHNGKTPLAVRVTEQHSLQTIIQALQLPSPRPTIFISSGAAFMDGDSMTATRSTIEDGLTRFVNDRQITVIDGGTTSGVMLLIGVARGRRNYTFPLIGVAPEKMVSYPSHEDPRKKADLDAYHSHFVLMDGEQFGAESDLILKLAYDLSGQGAKKRLCVVVNGGEIVKKEAFLCSTREPRFPLLVLEGSGRFADELSASREAGSADPQIQAILEQGRLHFISIKVGAENLYAWLGNFFRD